MSALSEAERARLAGDLAELMLHLADGFVADRQLGAENASIAVSAAIGTAVALIRRRGLDPRATIALITCTADAYVGDWKARADDR